MRPSAAAAVIIAGYVAKGGKVCEQGADALVERRRHDGKHAALAAAVAGDAGSIHVRPATEIIHGAHATQIGAFVVIRVAVFKALEHISRHRTVLQLAVHLRILVHGNAMDADVQHDETFVRQRIDAAEFPHGRSGKAQDGRFDATLLRDGQDSVHIVAGAVRLDADVIHIHAVVTLFRCIALPYQHRNLRCLCFCVLPERRKVVRQRSSGLDLVGVESDVGHPRVFLSIPGYTYIDCSESRHFASGHLDAGITVLVGRHLAALLSLQFLRTVAEFDLSQWHTDIFLHGIQREFSLLAAGIDPVGMVGFGIHRDILFRRLRPGKRQRKRKEDSEKNKSFHGSGFFSRFVTEG